MSSLIIHYLERLFVFVGLFSLMLNLFIFARIQASGCTFGYFIVYYKNFLSTSLQLTSNVQPKLYLYQPFLSSDRELMWITFYGWLESLSVCGKLCGKKSDSSNGDYATKQRRLNYHSLLWTWLSPNFINKVSLQVLINSYL